MASNIAGLHAYICKTLREQIRDSIPMAREIDLMFNVHFSPEQVDVAWKAVHASTCAQHLLQRNESGNVDWHATGIRVVRISTHVYMSLLLMQAKREQRGILHCSAELARERRNILSILGMLCGKNLTADEILNHLASANSLNVEELGPLMDPVRRDLVRLQDLRAVQSPYVLAGVCLG